VIEDNNTICYHGIQRVYRNAIVRHVRAAFKEKFADDFLGRLKKPFKKEEWDEIQRNAYLSRNTGELDTPIGDEFDLLSVSHFFNLFEANYEVLCMRGTPDSDADAKKAKQALLQWLKEIKTTRDPLSHPADASFDFDDAHRLLDSAKRVLLRLDLKDDANAIRELMKMLSGGVCYEEEVDPLLDSLPAKDSVVVDFVGRTPELEQLWKWLTDPNRRRWALSGDGGKGKSALAYHFAAEVKVRAVKPFQAVLWLSAKKRKFQEGVVVGIDEPSFTDLQSAVSRLLSHYGWLEEASASNPLEQKVKQVLELLHEFPALVVVDDIDSLDVEHEDVIEFFSLKVPETSSKVLFTSRRTIFGMGASTTQVKGFSEAEAMPFIQSRVELLGLDPALLAKKTVQEIVRVTEGSPLYVEDLVRLMAVMSAADAIKNWSNRGGMEARKYALGREIQLLSKDARNVLMAACVSPRALSTDEFAAIVDLSKERLTAALQQLQRLFLVPKPRLIEGEQRFEINSNTRTLVIELDGTSDQYRRIESAYKAVSGQLPRGHTDVAALIRQAVLRVKSKDQEGAADLLIKGLNKFPDHPDLKGVLGWVYTRAHPPNLTDARECFKRAWELKTTKTEAYVHWAKMELEQREWKRAAEAAEKGLGRVSASRELRYLGGYARQRLGKELRAGLHNERATEELVKAKEHLERALKPANELQEGERYLNADAYRALILTCEALDDTHGLRTYFEMWRKEHPDDINAITEWNRISRRLAI